MSFSKEGIMYIHNYCVEHNILKTTLQYTTSPTVARKELYKCYINDDSNNETHTFNKYLSDTLSQIKKELNDEYDRYNNEIETRDLRVKENKKEELQRRSNAWIEKNGSIKGWEEEERRYIESTKGWEYQWSGRRELVKMRSSVFWRLNTLGIIEHYIKKLRFLEIRESNRLKLLKTQDAIRLRLIEIRETHRLRLQELKKFKIEARKIIKRVLDKIRDMIIRDEELTKDCRVCECSLNNGHYVIKILKTVIHFSCYSKQQYRFPIDDQVIGNVHAMISLNYMFSKIQ
jgi:hypothetical protein